MDEVIVFHDRQLCLGCGVGFNRSERKNMHKLAMMHVASKTKEQALDSLEQITTIAQRIHFQARFN